MRSRFSVVLLGVLCGAAWGVAARWWMRLVSTDPEFTWAGTLFIVAVGAFAGLGMGTVLALRRRLRGIGVATMLPIGLGQGMIMLPTFVLGAFALKWRLARPRLAVLLAVLGVLPAILVGHFLLNDLSLVRAVACFVLYLGLMAWLAAMLTVSLRPVRPSRFVSPHTSTVDLCGDTNSSPIAETAR